MRHGPRLKWMFKLNDCPMRYLFLISYADTIRWKPSSGGRRSMMVIVLVHKLSSSKPDMENGSKLLKKGIRKIRLTSPKSGYVSFGSLVTVTGQQYSTYSTALYRHINVTHSRHITRGVQKYGESNRFTNSHIPLFIMSTYTYPVSITCQMLRLDN